MIRGRPADFLPAGPAERTLLSALRTAKGGVHTALCDNVDTVNMGAGRGEGRAWDHGILELTMINHVISFLSYFLSLVSLTYSSFSPHLPYTLRLQPAAIVALQELVGATNVYARGVETSGKLDVPLVRQVAMWISQVCKGGREGGRKKRNVREREKERE